MYALYVLFTLQSSWASSSSSRYYRRVLQPRCCAFGGVYSDWAKMWLRACRTAEVTIDCIEESCQLPTPLGAAGAIICRALPSGELEILKMSESIKGFLDHAKHVSELLPVSFREAHNTLLRDLLSRGALPSSSIHPLSVRIYTKNQRLMDATLKVASLPR
jgi:hypothetical protein